MRRIRFFDNVIRARAFAEEETEKYLMSDCTDKFDVVTISDGRHFPEVIPRFNRGEIDLLIIASAKLVDGWSVKGHDIHLEFDDEFPKSGPYREQAEGRLRPMVIKGKYIAIAPIPSSNHPEEWTFQFKTPEGKTRLHEDVVQGRTFTTRDVAKAEMIAFIDEQNRGLDIS